MRPQGQTFGQLYRFLRDEFRNLANETAELDAQLLISNCAGQEGRALALYADDVVPVHAADLARRYCARRLAGEPVARILGRKEFWSLDFELNEWTLVPRPDSECLVEVALEFLNRRRTHQWRLLDIGTGTGALLIALLKELPEACGVGLDIEPEAIEQARNNANRHGVCDRSGWIVGDMGAALRAPFDVVVTKPPYIPSADIDALPEAVRLYDPIAALDGGEDGLDAYRVITGQLPGLVADGGMALFEIGPGQADPVVKMLSGTGFCAPEIHTDLADRKRVVSVRRDEFARN